MKRRVLFVDDEPNVLKAMERMLRRQSQVWDMVFVTSVEAALEETSKANPDLIISDVMMPGKSGLDLLEAIGSSKVTADIPVIIVTGASEAGLKQRALDLGAADLLSKPVDYEELLARIRSVLRLKSYQDALIAQNETLEGKVRERTLELESSRIDIIWRLGKAAEYRDTATGNHVVRVGCISRQIAEALGMQHNFFETIFLASPLHDIGKIGIPDQILLKPGKLSPEEWEIMKGHCGIGAAILQQDSRLKRVFQEWHEARWPNAVGMGENPILEMASSIALSHHEKWDGSGYPNNLSWENIPLESRIVALSDVYDGLRSSRPYHAPHSEEEALFQIKSEVGKHFDPSVYASFDKSIEQIRWIRHQISESEDPHQGRESH